MKDTDRGEQHFSNTPQTRQQFRISQEDLLDTILHLNLFCELYSLPAADETFTFKEAKQTKPDVTAYNPSDNPHYI